MITAPKGTVQKIKLIMNVITPDNYETQKAKLRNYLFPEKKTRDEAFADEIEYNPEVH